MRDDLIVDGEALRRRRTPGRKPSAADEVVLRRQKIAVPDAGCHQFLPANGRDDHVREESTLDEVNALHAAVADSMYEPMAQVRDVQLQVVGMNMQHRVEGQ